MATKQPSTITTTTSTSPDTAAAITRLREEIARLHDERRAIAAAPLPMTEAVANLEARLNQLGRRYDPSGVATFVRDADADVEGDFLWPDGRYDPQQARAFVAAVHGDRLLAMWRGHLEGIYAADPALAATAIPLGERPGRLAEIARRVFDLELDEERAVVESEARGAPISRRPDVDVSVLFDESLLDAAAL